MKEMKSLTLNGKKYDSFVDQTAREMAVQPDWNAKEGEAGYVKNRTHYEQTGAVVMPETALALLDEGYFAVEHTGEALVSGKSYAVFYNGEKYVCTASEADGGVYVGNNKLMTGIDSGEPFFAALLDGTLMVVPFDGAASCVLSILENNVVKIPARFVPYERYEVDLASLAVDDKNRSQRNYDDIAAALYAKRNVVLVSHGEVDGITVLTEAHVISWMWTSAAGLSVTFVLTDRISSIFFPNGTWTPPAA